MAQLIVVVQVLEAHRLFALRMQLHHSETATIIEPALKCLLVLRT
jgi:hypothetical protein